jgi:hypothetical protein
MVSFLPTSADRVVAFYSGGKDDRGRTLEEIWTWSDEELEQVHDYIQWVFPTSQASAVNPSAPLVTRETTRAFHARPELREALGYSLERMLAFYGLRQGATVDTLRVEIAPERFPERGPHWLRRGNHNHLRLTRILQSLSSLGLTDEARALQRCLVHDIYEGPGRGKITDDTYRFWMAAVTPPA